MNELLQGLMPVFMLWGGVLAFCAVGCLICSPFLALEALLNRHFDKQAAGICTCPGHSSRHCQSGRRSPLPPHRSTSG